MDRVLVALILVGSFAVPALAADPMAKEIDEAFKRNCEAGNVPGVLALYAEDATAVWPGQGEEARGKANIEKLATNFCKNTTGLKLTIKSVEARSLGRDYIAIVGHWEVSFTEAGGKTMSADVRTTEILKNTGGKWLYIVDHASIGTPPPSAKP